MFLSTMYMNQIVNLLNGYYHISTFGFIFNSVGKKSLTFAHEHIQLPGQKYILVRQQVIHCFFFRISICILFNIQTSNLYMGIGDRLEWISDQSLYTTNVGSSPVATHLKCYVFRTTLMPGFSSVKWKCLSMLSFPINLVVIVKQKHC